MKNIKLIIFILLLLSVNFKAHAYDNCYKSGYTVVSINGIFTDAIGAKNNKENLKKILPAAYKNESVIVDYIYNSTHLAGFGDIVDVVRQGFFDPDSDFDLVEMLNDASQKIKTQKVLLVGHSQGNFYANNFYDKVAGKIGGVPTESIGVYEVATPSNRVSGGGKYLTSDTDSVIASLVSSVKNIMAPNTHINLSDIKSNGHDFSEVYLKYRGDQIVSDIKSSFDKLSVNNIQDDLSKCISPQEISLGHKISGVVLAAADFVVNSIINIGTFSYNKITSTTKSLVGLFGNNTSSNLAAAGLYDSQNLPDVVESILPTTDVPIEVVDNNNQLITEEKVKNTNTESTSPVVGSSDNIEIPIITPNESVITTAEVDSSENSNGSGHDNTGGGGGSNPSDTEIITDKIGPVITIIGESIIKIPLNTVYVDAGATALDEKDGIIPVVSTGTVDITTIGTYTITYTTTDTENNVSTLNRVINIVKNEIIELPKIDTIAPVITLNGENNVNIFLGVVYIDAGATALDKTDGVISVVTTGVVDITKIETYTLTYTATDIAKNVSTLIRTVNVVAVPIIQNIPPSPVASTTATLLLPNSGAYAGDGLDPSRGRKNLTPFVFQVIYTDSSNNAPANIKLHVKNTATGIYLADVSMDKIALGSDVLSDGNYVNGELYTSSNIYDQGDYSYSFSADDQSGNFTKIEENSKLRFSAISSTYIYTPKYSFGINNGDDLDWQVWAFNGSNVYDWTDTYVNNYLREQFRIQAYPGFWCSQCLQRGIFNHDPQKGFEASDVVLSGLENDPQNSGNGKIYDVAIQWDSTGYTYTLTNDSIVYATGHTDVADINNNMWVGWDGSFNSFTTFPSGSWQDIPYASPMNRTGGGSMILQPYPVYDPLAVQTPDPTPIPIPDPIPVLSSTKLITSFNFESISPIISGIINETDHTIKLTVPYGTVITSLVPTIIVSDKSSVLPTSIVSQDFTNPVTYIVKAEDDSTLSYIVTVIVSPNSDPIPVPITDPIVSDDSLPIITSYTLNGNQSGITINPPINNLNIVLNSNKNVNWMSIKIEKESDAQIYKMFLSSSITCIDGTNVCTKIWDGNLSSGELLQSGNYDGNYRIKVHMKDVANNEYEDYLPSVITVNSQ